MGTPYWSYRFTTSNFRNTLAVGNFRDIHLVPLQVQVEITIPAENVEVLLLHPFFNSCAFLALRRILLISKVCRRLYIIVNTLWCGKPILIRIGLWKRVQGFRWGRSKISSTWSSWVKVRTSRPTEPLIENDFYFLFFIIFFVSLS